VAHDEQAAARCIVLRDIDLAGQDDGQAVAHGADFGERLARLVRAELAEPTYTLDFRVLQREEHLGAARLDDRLP
jgi:hypothetical protein